MPPIYTSNNSNFIQLTNESDAKFHIQTNDSVRTTIQLLSAITTSYSKLFIYFVYKGRMYFFALATTTASPKGLSPIETVVIVLGGIGFFFAICVAIICIYRRKKSRKFLLSISIYSKFYVFSYTDICF